MTQSNSKIQVWDAPVRVFHWLLVLCFAGAYLTAESERWRMVHVTLGYTLGGLVVFRIFWGLVGTRYARFSNFVRGPKSVIMYLRGLWAGKPAHYLGHNPAGAVAIVLMLMAALVVVASGWAFYNDLGGNWLEELHEGSANAMLLVVITHIGGVGVASWLHRENLPKSMLTGNKSGPPQEGIARRWRILAALILAAALAFWWLQWSDAPALANHAVKVNLMEPVDADIVG